MHGFAALKSDLLSEAAMNVAYSIVTDHWQESSFAASASAAALHGFSSDRM